MRTSAAVAFEFIAITSLAWCSPPNNQPFLAVDPVNYLVRGQGSAYSNKSLVELPSDGQGLYRDPVDVLGSQFPGSVTVHLCEIEILMYAEELEKVTFTPKGTKLCADVCLHYKKNMVIEGDIAVELMRSQCNYIGSECGKEKIGLEKSCACPYVIRCKERAEVITYSFQPNCDGFLRVAVYETRFHRYIT